MCSSSFNADSKAKLKKLDKNNIKAKFNSTKNETGQHEQTGADKVETTRQREIDRRKACG